MAKSLFGHSDEPHWVHVCSSNLSLGLGWLKEITAEIPESDTGTLRKPTRADPWLIPPLPPYTDGPEVKLTKIGPHYRKRLGVQVAIICWEQSNAGSWHRWEKFPVGKSFLNGLKPEDSNPAPTPTSALSGFSGASLLCRKREIQGEERGASWPQVFEHITKRKYGKY